VKKGPALKIRREEGKKVGTQSPESRIERFFPSYVHPFLPSCIVASRRVTLFGRLLDENDRRLAPGRTPPAAQKVGRKEGKK